MHSGKGTEKEPAAHSWPAHHLCGALTKSKTIQGKPVAENSEGRAQASLLVLANTALQVFFTYITIL